MTVTVPHPPLAGQTIVAADELENLTALSTALGNLTASNFGAGAGLGTEHFADKYSGWSQVVQLIPAYDGVKNFVTPSTVQARIVLRLPASRVAFITSIDFAVLEVNIASGDWPEIEVTLDGTVLGGAAVTIDSATEFTLANSPDSYAAPQAIVKDGQIIEVLIGATGPASPGPDLRGVTMTIWGKMEVMP